MQKEQLAQWVLWFYIYCFIGWVWETCYVSICKKKFVNRGFMKGPLLPIYGSGALCILLVSGPFKGNYLLMAVVGMIAATVLEYVTGAAMEALFRVRYWDYSDEFLNLNGYVCLKSTLCWGVMTLGVVYIVHPPIERFVAGLRDNIVSFLDMVITILAVADFSTSFKDAWDFRNLLIRAEKLREEMRSIQIHLEAMSAELAESVQENFQELKERTREAILEETTRTVEALQEKTGRTVEALQEKTGRTVEALQEKTGRTVEALQEKTGRTVEALQEKTGRTVEALQEKAERTREAFQEKTERAKESFQENTEKKKAQLQKEQLQKERQELYVRKAMFQEGLRSGSYRGIHGLLKRNPGTVWKPHPEVLEEIKKMFREHGKEKEET